MNKETMQKIRRELGFELAAAARTQTSTPGVGARDVAPGSKPTPVPGKATSK